MNEEGTNCRLCGSGRLRKNGFGYFFNERWLDGLECRECGAIFLRPRPTEEELRELYSKEYFDHDFRCGHQGSYFAEATLAALVDHALLDRIQRYRPSGRFLEIGCAGGAFLHAARARGYAVQGVEFSPDAAAFARERFGLEVVTGSLGQADLGDGQFDVVFMGDVIEHLAEPVATLKEIYRVLAPGGVLVLVCPSQTNTLFARLGLFLYRLFGLRVRVNLPPYHLFEYRPGSIRHLLRACGFEILQVNGSMIPPSKIALRGSLVQKVGKKVVQYPNYALTTLTGLYGDRLEVHAVKR